VNSEQGDDEQDNYNKTHCTSSPDAAHHGVKFLLQTMHTSVRLIACVVVCVCDICPQLQARKKNLLKRRGRGEETRRGGCWAFIERKMIQCL